MISVSDYYPLPGNINLIKKYDKFSYKKYTMKINLINLEQYNRLKEIQKTHPKLTFNNKGYEYIKKDTLSEEDLEAFKEVSDILEDHIIGFIEFNNFQDARDVIRLRFQYNWGAEENSLSFKGVGYIELDELFKGFKP